MASSARGPSYMFILLLCVCLYDVAASARVKGFNIVNTETGRFVRSLVDNDVLSFPHPVTLIAVAPGARFVTFTVPWRVVDRTKPRFSFPREIAPTRLRPLRVKKNVAHTLRAFADGRPGQAVSVRFRVVPFMQTKPSLPARGPGPLDITPVIPDGVTDVDIPDISPQCTQPVPTIRSFRVDVEPRRDDFFELDVGWCAGQNPLRVRILSYELVRDDSGKYKAKTVVLRSSLWNVAGVYRTRTQNFKQRCVTTKIYAEVCGRRNDGKTPICATSALLDPYTDPLFEPMLVSRGPFSLRLAPGDRARVGYTIKAGKPSAVGNPSFSLDEKFRIQVMAVSKAGKTLGASRWVDGLSVSALLPFKQRRRGVRPDEYDGAQVFLRYAYQSCPSNIGTLRGREATEVSVKQQNSPLIRQDSEVPMLEKLVYPPTKVGQPVKLTVNVKDAGNGQRGDGSKTGLSYQWYKLEGTNFINPEYPRKLDGETGASLTIQEAECEVESCFRDGCQGLQTYHVAVCNTRGCVFSNPVSPSIINEEDCPPPLF